MATSRTLLEMLNSADLAAKRLVEHLKFDVAPKAKNLRRLAKETRLEEVGDKEIRIDVARLLQCDGQTKTEYEQLLQICVRIDESLAAVLAQE